MAKLLDYLNHLDQNADARTAHAKDPTHAMTKYGLTHEEQATFNSGDKVKVAHAVGIKPAELPTIEVTHFSTE
ncbi:hypothetical protein [Undibacterium sp. RuRC25W]|uniref:hypothetical protein n=1 Tax=Undibacterium sp. RuRC25W TaxID=3413047 RepID=UPI003BF14F9B